MPPSLWLSAFMAMRTYLTVVMSVIVQMSSDSAPSTTSSLMVARPPLPPMIALRVYIGLVPMSPYTTPSVTSTMPMEKGMPVLGCLRFFSKSLTEAVGVGVPPRLMSEPAIDSTLQNNEVSAS